MAGPRHLQYIEGLDSKRDASVSSVWLWARAEDTVQA